MVAALMLWYRFLVPITSAFRHRMVVAAVVTEGTGVYSIHVSGRHLDDLHADSGQFFRWRFLTGTHWWQSHPYSLSAAPTDTGLRITVKSLGDHSHDLRNLKVGTRIFAEGPYGALTHRRRTRRQVLLLAGGIGITPLRALFETLPARPGELTLLYRAAAADVVFRRELDHIASARDARVVYLTGKRGTTRDPFLGHRLLDVVPGLPDHDVYLCGPGPMMTAAEEALLRCGVPRRHIHSESFDF
jgi:ferredoxin-NADP reductase